MKAPDSWHRFSRYLVARRSPGWDRILLVESGPRELAERVLQNMRAVNPTVAIDVLTCYQGAPAGMPDESEVYSVNEHRGWGNRSRLAAALAARQYCVTGVICAGTPVLPKWKWWAAWHARPSKILIVNENADWFWLDAYHLAFVGRLVAARLGIGHGAGERMLDLVGHAVVFPFALAYLLAFAAYVHLRRALRLAFRPR